MRTRTIACFLIGLLLSGLASANGTPTLKALYDQHRWFALREAIKNNKHASPLYLGALASAFNRDGEAEKYLNRVIELEPTSDDAVQAHTVLGYLYGRAGRNHQALQEFESILQVRPRSAEAQNARAIYAAFSQHPDLSVGKIGRTVVQGEISNGNLLLPVSIHGETRYWVFDTYFNVCAMTESEARLLGIAVNELPAQVADSAGGRVKVRTAFVSELAIGEVHVRNVSFIILPDSMGSTNSPPSGHIGIPVILALKSIQWKADGAVEIGFTSAHDKNAESNLSFDGLNLVTRTGFEGKGLDFIVDSGNHTGTQLWPNFEQDFSDLVSQQGVHSTQSITEIGGSRELDVILLPAMPLIVGGMNVLLPHPAVFSKPVGDNLHDGLLGMDVFGQVKRVRIDFRSMTLKLLP